MTSTWVKAEWRGDFAPPLLSTRLFARKIIERKNRDEKVENRKGENTVVDSPENVVFPPCAEQRQAGAFLWKKFVAICHVGERADSVVPGAALCSLTDAATCVGI